MPLNTVVAPERLERCSSGGHRGISATMRAALIIAGVVFASNAVADGHMFCTFPQGTVMIFQFGSTEFNAATGGHEVVASFQDGSFW